MAQLYDDGLRPIVDRVMPLEASPTRIAGWRTGSSLEKSSSRFVIEP